MINLARIVGFDWDAGNARKSAERHSVSQPEAEQIFFDRNLIIGADISHSAVEPRFHAFGATAGGRRLHVSFTLRGGSTLIRVISARDMSAKERQYYAQKSQANP